MTRPRHGSRPDRDSQLRADATYLKSWIQSHSGPIAQPRAGAPIWARDVLAEGSNSEPGAPRGLIRPGARRAVTTLGLPTYSSLAALFWVAREPDDSAVATGRSQ